MFKKECRESLMASMLYKEPVATIRASVSGLDNARLMASLGDDATSTSGKDGRIMSARSLAVSPRGVGGVNDITRVKSGSFASSANIARAFLFLRIPSTRMRLCDGKHSARVLRRAAAESGQCAPSIITGGLDCRISMRPCHACVCLRQVYVKSDFVQDL